MRTRPRTAPAVAATPIRVLNRQAAAASKFTLQERIYRKLREAIGTGRFASGEVMTLRGIAADFGTSAMPVREAMRRLAAEKALEMLPNRLIRVPLVSRQRFDELTELRQLLEGRCAAAAAVRASDTELREIQLLSNRLSEAIKHEDYSYILRTNHEYHFAVYRAANSPVLLEVVETLWLQSGPYLAALSRALQQRKSRLGELNLSRHEEITAALLAGDGEAARSVLADDIAQTAEWYCKIVGFNQRPEPPARRPPYRLVRSEKRR